MWQAGLAPPLVSGEQPAEAIFAVPRSGEFAVHVLSDSPDVSSEGLVLVGHVSTGMDDLAGCSRNCAVRLIEAS